ncbi:hypothetical protein E2C01_025892 [Portunus trituberculatus]|uniref:Uncharacterized protein n=1 Tax=Portunus trituberculatus TaxID=210409 RepID=A0A5B7EGY3_PORTR|nr:hypothetical protein [Portunus trituberculatus]
MVTVAKLIQAAAPLRHPRPSTFQVSVVFRLWPWCVDGSSRRKKKGETKEKDEEERRKEEEIRGAAKPQFR